MNDWKDYEHFVVKYHQDTYQHITYHWSAIPEEILYECGFINDTNKIRLQRKRDKEEGITNSIQEYGLDGIIKDENGIYHGLQAKCYDGRSYLKASDIGTFLSVLFLRMKSKNPLSKGYLYHTCKLESNLRDDIAINENKDIIQIHTPSLMCYNNPEIQTECKKEGEVLRYYQKDAIQKMNEPWSSMKQLIQMPCGTGKSVVIANYLKNQNYDHIYIFSPLRVLAKQNLYNMGKYMDDYEKILVDSDKDGTRSIEEIRKKMVKKCILSSTYDSVLDVIDKIADHSKNSIVIVDEAHNLYDDLVNILNKFQKVVLLTATPSKKMKEILQCNTLYEYKMDKAIEDKYICDYRIYVPYLEDCEDNIPVEFSMYEKEVVAKVMYLINSMLMKGCRRAIVYLKSVDECITFNNIFKHVMEEYHYLPYWCGRINKDTNDKERTECLDEFQKEKVRSDTLHILSSVRILDEGVDIIKCDSVFICGGNHSGNEIRTLQRMCRANRLDSMNPNKIAHCFMWCNQWSESLTLIHNMKELDHKFIGKVSHIGVNYTRNCVKEVYEKIKIANEEIKQYIQIKCIDVNESQMNRAIQLVERAKLRAEKGLNLMPKSYVNWREKSEEIQQENRDNQTIADWRKAVNGKKDKHISSDVKEYLDKELKGWTTLINYEEEAYKEALAIVQRLKVDEYGEKIHPINRRNVSKKYNSPEEEQETKDAIKLAYWARALKKDESTVINRAICYPKVKELLDQELPGWNLVRDINQSHIEKCKMVVENSKKRVLEGLNRYPIKFHIREDEIVHEEDKVKLSKEEYEKKVKNYKMKKIESDDSVQLSQWRNAYLHLQKGIEFYITNEKRQYYICPDEVVQMLNDQFPNWNIENKDEIEELEKVMKIVERCNERVSKNKSCLPKFKNSIKIEDRTEEQIQEASDANKLSLIRKGYIQYQTGKVSEKERKYKCYQSVIDYLNEKIPGWNEEKKIEDNKEQEEKQMKSIIEIINRCNERKEKGLNLLPKYNKTEGLDAEKLNSLAKGKNFLYKSVRKYLDENLKGWDKK